MTAKKSFGKHIRKLRIEHKLLLRKVASALDLEPSTLSKIGERTADKEMLPLLAELFTEKELSLIFFATKLLIRLWKKKILMKY